MDINALAGLTAGDEQAAVIPITLKNGDPLTAKDGSQCTISVLGSDAKQYRREKESISRSLLHSRKSKLEPADLERNRIRQAASAVVAWHGFDLDGQPAPCTADNVKRVLAHEWILEQVEQGITAHADFFVNSSST